MKFVKINAPLSLHFKLFLKKKEKTFKEKKGKVKNSGQIYDSIFKENEVFFFFFAQSIDFCFWSVLATVHMQFTHFKHTNLQAFDTELGNYCPYFHPLDKPVPISSYSSFSPPSNPSNH